MINRQENKEIIIRRAIIKPYELVPLAVYALFLVGLILEGNFNLLFQVVFFTIGVFFMIVGFMRLMDLKPKIIINENGINLIDENRLICWREILNVEIVSKKMRKWNSFKVGYDSTINNDCLVINLKDKEIVEKIVEKYRLRKRDFNEVIKHYTTKKLLDSN